jgi:hypothetical protein
MASPLNGPGQLTLVFGAGSGLAARPDFAVFADEAAQQVGLLEIDHCSAIGTELANAGAGIIPPASLRCLIGHFLLLLNVFIRIASQDLFRSFLFQERTVRRGNLPLLQFHFL